MTTSCRIGNVRSRHSLSGVLRIVSGGAQIGAYLVGHELVTDIHVTGSDKTHDAIVFGVVRWRSPQGDQQPLVTKPLSAELGNVSPS